MFSAFIDLRCTLQAAIRVCSSRVVRAWRDGIPGILPCAACANPAWSTVDVRRVPLDDAARVAGRELPLNDTSPRSASVIKGYVAGLYLPGCVKNVAVVLGMEGPKWLQIRPLRDMDADTFIHALSDGIYCNQTEVQMQKLADRLTRLEDAMHQTGSTKRGDAINFDYTPSAGTTISINGVTHTKIIPGEDFYQAVLNIFIGNGPVDRELKNGLPGN